ncbi:hypothetical protein SH661x_003113 [Planctomicrobium sp. SH661]|uniref:hypothetical protein n=1 Tax=Planctomicrobium sp. SH661 TaxID=3448124 RepID=UPI003F5C1996
MNLQPTTFRISCLTAACLLGMIGCTPAPDQKQTVVLPASALQIRMNKSGRAEVSREAAEDTPVKGDATAEPASDAKQ